MNKKMLRNIICVIVFVVIGIIFAVVTGKYTRYIPSSLVVGFVMTLVLDGISNNKEKNK